MNSALAVAIIFALSLVGAVVLFRFFKSSAIIKKKAYQAGGAVAGFAIIYSLLFASYYEIERQETKRLKHTIADLEVKVKELEIDVVSGVVEPDNQPVKVRLVFDAVEPDSDGKFKFKVPRILLNSPTLALYAITDDEHVILDMNCEQPPCQLPESSFYLYAEKIDGIKIPMRLMKR
jgi:hypothetical protein